MIDTLSVWLRRYDIAHPTLLQGSSTVLYPRVARSFDPCLVVTAQNDRGSFYQKREVPEWLTWSQRR
jgi:hypothetical protein